MWKLRTSSYGEAFPRAALIDYVVRKDSRSLQPPRKTTSFLASDSYRPPFDPVNASENYFGAPADECVDLKAADYILQKRLSLQVADSDLD